MSEEKSAPAASDPADLMLKLAQSLFGSRKGSEKEGLSHRLLDKSEQKYRTLVEQIPAVTFLASFEEKNNEIYVSPQIESLLGYTQEEWLSEPILWYQRLHPDDQGRWNREFAQTVSSGAPFRGVYRFVARDGRIVWIHGEARVAYDADGRPLFIQGVGFDVTDLKNAEESLKRKNEDLGQFAYAASHDLREPLRMIASFTQLLEKKYGDKFDGESRAWLSEIVRGAQRARSLVDSLLTYARIDEVRPVEPVDFNDLLKDVLSNLTVAISESRAKITSDRLPLVRGRRTDLSRLLQNLLENALKFRAPDRAPAIHVTAKAQGIEWVFSVRDNGIGIDPQYFPKLFKVFQRLHLPSEYRGEGIGLAMARKIVEGHGGRIWVESREGEGATFFFTLPRAGQE